LQFGIGITCITLSLVVLMVGYPVLDMSTIIILLLISLLVIGIGRIVRGLLIPSISVITTERDAKKVRKAGLTDLVLGTISFLFSTIFMIFPQAASERPFVLLSLTIIVMFNGFGMIMQGIFNKHESKSLRVMGTSIGVVSMGLSIFASNAYRFGIIFPTKVLSVILVIYGIENIIFSITGKLSVIDILKKRQNRDH
jgi:hypothetical protein